MPLSNRFRVQTVGETKMAEETGQTRRWVLNASGTAFLAGAIAPVVMAALSRSPRLHSASGSSGSLASAPAIALAAAPAAAVPRVAVVWRYSELRRPHRRDAPIANSAADVIARAKLHIPRHVRRDDLGLAIEAGNSRRAMSKASAASPEATVIGSKILTVLCPCRARQCDDGAGGRN